MFTCHEITRKLNESSDHFKGKLLICQQYLKPKFGHSQILVLQEEFPRRAKKRADLVLYNVIHKRVEVWVEIIETPELVDLSNKVDFACNLGVKFFIIGLTPKASYLAKQVQSILSTKKVEFEIFNLDFKRWRILPYS